MSMLALKVLQEIQAALDNDQLVLPTMPEMALKVREVLKMTTPPLVK